MGFGIELLFEVWVCWGLGLSCYLRFGLFSVGDGLLFFDFRLGFG